MNLNISARDAELARLGKEIRSLKLDREQRASSLKEGAIPNNLHYQSSQKMHIDDSAVKVVFPVLSVLIQMPWKHFLNWALRRSLLTIMRTSTLLP